MGLPSCSCTASAHPHATGTRSRAPAATTGGIAPDLLGFGRSPKPRHCGYAVPDHLDALLTVVSDGALVVGHSTGAVLAAALAAQNPCKARGLLLIGLPIYPDDVTARREIARLGFLARMSVEQRSAARMLCGLMCTFRPLAMVVARLLATDVPRAVAADCVRHTWRSYSQTLERVVIGHGPALDLFATACPTLLLHGRNDRVAPPWYVEELAARAASSRSGVTARIVDGDHHLPLRRPDIVASAIAELASP
ncbi:MAG: alpha/beta fold hydrolase [Acidimicrobiia bacterium]